MHITYHAGERFLQRVFGWSTYTKKEVIRAMKLLKRDLQDIQSSRGKIILPTFPDYYGITKKGALVTIIPKR